MSQALYAHRTSTSGVTLTECYSRSSRVRSDVLLFADLSVELSNTATCRVPLSKGDYSKEKTPNTKRLCCGRAAFGFTPNPEESPADANEMYYFTSNYAIRSEGVLRIAKALSENKGRGLCQKHNYCGLVDVCNLQCC